MTLLDSYPAVEDALWRYADAYQVRTATITTIPSGRASGDRLPFRAAFLDRLDERSELKARLAWLDHEEQVVVLRWYVEGAPLDPEPVSGKVIWRPESAGFYSLMVVDGDGRQVSSKVRVRG